MEQSFSTSNLKRIWDLQTRKGDDRLLELFPDVKEAFLNRRDARRELRAASRLPLIGDAETVLARRAETASKSAEEARDAALADTSDALITAVEERKFSWGLRETAPVNGRRTFAIARTPGAFFAEQVLQRAVGDITAHRPTARQSIIANVTRVLDSNIPKLVIRTDFERFYENIDHRMLRRRLAQDFLSPTFRGLVEALLQETHAILGTDRGLPTGVGLSAKLAEYFLADFDRQMSGIPRTLYYGRYVDDVVLILGEVKHGELDAGTELTRIGETARKNGLSLSSTKTTVARTSPQWILAPFELLGYKLSSGPRATVSLTDGRQDELKRRIDCVFSSWSNCDQNNHGNRRLLIDRLRYLTGNFRLANNKRNAFIGIYFSNPHLRDADLLQDLDRHLATARNAAMLDPGLDVLVKTITFADGFESRRLHRFTSHQLRRVRRAWDA
ncbi:antiviral reverse transcriptase Drt3a [Curtobacterium poinsettiae]|uniref:antiviral reverse transcriptase Drt3a n=1 Tax=Curtobacterium poinsettiae TaxID=159612 RepID=UPI00399F6983